MLAVCVTICSPAARGQDAAARGTPTAGFAARTKASPPLATKNIAAPAKPLPTASQARILAPGKKQSGYLPWQQAEQELPLALGGYCPVTLRDREQWQPGDPRFVAAFDERRYLFASAKLRGAFVADPERYAPVLREACPVTFRERGQLRPGQLEYGLVYDGRLFFFVGAAERQRFTASPQDYADADLANGGMCLVSRIDEQLVVPGDPRTLAVYAGERYLFAGAKQRTLFLANPGKYLGHAAPQQALEAEPTAPPPVAAAPAAQRNTPPKSIALEPAPPKPLSEAQRQLALRGYCPVSIRDEARWVRGSAEVQTTIDDLTFAFAGEAQRTRFLQDPARYIPALGGICPVKWVEEQQVVPGTIYHAIELPELDILFMFSSESAVRRFKANPQRYARVDLANSGNCPVTLKDQTQLMPGDPKYRMWYAGARYLFATEERMRQFAANPARYAVDPQAALVKSATLETTAP